MPLQHSISTAANRNPGCDGLYLEVQVYWLGPFLKVYGF